jgi:hypothetical protein
MLHSQETSYFLNIKRSTLHFTTAETVLVSEELNKQQVAVSRGQATENTPSTTQSKHNLFSLQWLGFPCLQLFHICPQSQLKRF